MSVSRLLVLRHVAVRSRYDNRCYGSLDAGLDAAGRAATREVAVLAGRESLVCVHASPSRRARLLGGRIAAALGVPLRVEARLRERCFGCWEGRSWDDIWTAEGDAMNGMLDAPDAYRPGGSGETTAELAARVLDWFDGLPAGCAMAAVAHGGPIAALAGTLGGAAPRDWLRFVPGCGRGWDIEPREGGWRITRWPPPPAAPPHG